MFASANTSNMDQVAEAGEPSGEAEIFVTNSLQIAVPTGNPGGVTGLEDFAREELLIGLCAEDVPCGDFGRQALDNARSHALDRHERAGCPRPSSPRSRPASSMPGSPM